MPPLNCWKPPGYRVQLANAECCGRPMISKGMLDEAASHARYNVDRLYPFADQGVPIIGCEPSCLLTFRDEYPEFCRDERADKVAEHSYLIDEFLAMLEERGELELRFTGLEKQVLFHGHCHEKSLVGTAPSLAALRLPPGYQVELINSGCCGMAGSFGFEKEHYDVSMAIGEQVLFPAIREHGTDWEVAVMGVSCRQQVEHGTGRPARHLVEVLRGRFWREVMAASGNRSSLRVLAEIRRRQRNVVNINHAIAVAIAKGQRYGRNHKHSFRVRRYVPKRN